MYSFYRKTPPSLPRKDNNITQLNADFQAYYENGRVCLKCWGPEAGGTGKAVRRYVEMP